MKKILIVALLALAGCTTQTTKSGSEGNIENRAKLHTELAAAYYAQGQMAIALDEFNKATQLDPDYAPAYTGLGLVHAALKQDDKAEANFKRSLQLDPDSSDSHNNYGTFLCVRNRIDEAVKQFMTAVSNPLYTTPESAYLNAGICSLKKKDDKSAENYFLTALKIQPGLRSASYQLANLYFKQGDNKRSRIYLQQSMQNIEPTPEMLWLGIRNARALGDRDTEASYSLLLKKKYPNSDETKAMLAE